MGWLQISTTVAENQVDTMEELLLAAGAVSVTLQDNLDKPILEPGVGETPLWPEIKLTALFEATTNANTVLEQLYQAEKLLAEPNAETLARTDYVKRFSSEIIEDKNWEREWLNHFEPIPCGNRLWVCPSWCEPPDNTAINLMLDPGLAFGSGTHETTLLCLQWLDKHKTNSLRVLDFGCGSGILGIAALLLGAAHCDFVDNDPQALQATRDNLQKNAIAPNQFTIHSAEEFQSPPKNHYDIVIANILSTPLIELADLLANSVIEQGWLTLSGIQSQQEKSVRSAYKHHLEFGDREEKNNWLRLSDQKPG